MFKSDPMGIPIIEATAVIPEATGTRGYEKRDRTIDPTAGFAKPYTVKTMTKKELVEIFAEREQKKIRIFDRMKQANVKPLNQGNTPFCWANGATDCVQIMRVLNGMEHVPLSPASVAGPIKNYKYVGGWGLEALKYGSEHGWVRQALWPANEANKKYDTDVSRADRLNFQVAPDGWVDLPEGDWLAVFTMLALGFPCTLAHMEWQHLVTAIDGGIAANGELMALCRNSGYGRDSTGHSWVKMSFGAPDEALALQVVTAA